MKEPTTVKEAKQLTLDKIRECMELPTVWARRKFWWSNGCAFCLLTSGYLCPGEKGCLAYKACNYLCRYVEIKYSDYTLNKLYHMVEAIEC